MLFLPIFFCAKILGLWIMFHIFHVMNSWNSRRGVAILHVVLVVRSSCFMPCLCCISNWWERGRDFQCNSEDLSLGIFRCREGSGTPSLKPAHLSHEKNNWLFRGFRGWNTTQLCGDYILLNHYFWIFFLKNQDWFHAKYHGTLVFFFRGLKMCFLGVGDLVFKTNSWTLKTNGKTRGKKSHHFQVPCSGSTINTLLYTWENPGP